MSPSYLNVISSFLSSLRSATYRRKMGGEAVVITTGFTIIITSYPMNALFVEHYARRRLQRVIHLVPQLRKTPWMPEPNAFFAIPLCLNLHKGVMRQPGVRSEMTKFII